MKNINETTDMKTTIETGNLEGVMKSLKTEKIRHPGMFLAGITATSGSHASYKRDSGLRHSGMTAFIMAALLSINGLANAAGKGTSGGQFLRIDAGARGAAMSGAVSPIVDDATAIYYNPAGMSRMEQREVSVAYNAYFKDTASQFLGYTHPTAEHGAFGIGVSLFGVKDIERRSADTGDSDAAAGTFNTQDLAVSLGWANKMALGNGRLHYGGALKYISSNLNVKTAVTGAADLGAMWDLREDGGLTFSIAMLNIGGELKFQDEGDPLPLNIKPGVAYRMNFQRMGKLTLALNNDNYIHDGKSFFEPGVEWSPVPMFSLRGGYQLGRDTDAGSGVSVGVGFNLMRFKLDYAFVPYGDLGDTHRISLGYKF
jgi:hypothetical protein